MDMYELNTKYNIKNINYSKITPYISNKKVLIK
jgi:hypothetical protein